MNEARDTKWHFYKGFYVSSVAPHETVDATAVKNKRSLGMRWTSDFDTGQETAWWYIIKDRPFDIFDIKAKRRYEIKKGAKNFEVGKIDPEEYEEELFDVFKRSMRGYPSKDRPANYKDSFFKFAKAVKAEKNIQIIYGAFFKETKELCGFLHIPTYPEWAALSMMKTDPEYEKYGINAALIYQVLLDYNDRLAGEYYLCDGQRTINHKTNFQDYLEKYFLFRKAYCKLNIKYTFLFGAAIKIIYPFRVIFEKFDFIKTVHIINALLKMEECSQKCKKKEEI